MPHLEPEGESTKWLRGLFAATVGLGAFLLFLVQFVLAKRLLPWFGGVPAVWTTCMLFFQLGLLVGYLYAHAIVGRFSPKAQRTAHLVVLALALTSLIVSAVSGGLPLVPGDPWKPAPEAPPVSSLLLLLLWTAGLPFVVVSATGPLLQSWYARLFPAERPWRLYALSNVGSLVGLLAYPFVVERFATVETQGWLWSVGFLIFAILCGTTAILAARTPPLAAEPASEAVPAREATLREATLREATLREATLREATLREATLREATLREATLREAEGGAEEEAREMHPSVVVHWAALAMVASVLLLATTSQICQEIAVVPLLWMLPLALYLVSFIVCFEWEGVYKRWIWLPLVAISAVASTWALFEGATLRILVQVAIHSATLFVYCMACHGELYRLRPGKDRLTAFYLCIALGGALGGVFSAVLGPLLFPGFWELHWALVEGAALFVLLLLQDGPLGPREQGVWRWVGRFALVAGCFTLTGALLAHASRTLAGAEHVERTFFGVLRVTREVEGTSDECRKLRHGRITHGLQLDDPVRRYEPTTYYGPVSGIGLAITKHPRRVLPRFSGQRELRVAVVGLGVGTLAAYGTPGDVFRFYEIDKAVMDLSTGDSPVFTYLADSNATVELVQGDARLSLDREEPGRFDVIAVDAFSSDSIPTHLLTVEAFRVYARHLRDPKGIVAFHISNRYLKLEPVVAALERETGWNGLLVASERDDDMVWKSDWALLCRDALVLTDAPFSAVGQELSNPLTRPWTDGQSDLLTILRW